MNPAAAGNNRALVKAFGQGARQTVVLKETQEARNLAEAKKFGGGPEHTGKATPAEAWLQKEQRLQEEQARKGARVMPARGKSQNWKVKLRTLKLRGAPIPDPGSIAFPLTVLLLLVFFFVPIPGSNMTRATLLWNVLTGDISWHDYRGGTPYNPATNTFGGEFGS